VPSSVHVYSPEPLIDTIEEATMPLRLVQKHLSNNTPLYPRRPVASAAQMWEPRIFNVHWSQILTQCISTSPSMFKLGFKFYLRCTLTLPFRAACQGRQHFHCFHTFCRTSILCLLPFARLSTGFIYCVIRCLS